MTLDGHDAVFTDYTGQKERRARILASPRLEIFARSIAEDVIQERLRALCEALQMDLVLLGHVNEREYTVVALHCRDPSYALHPGDKLPIDETYCRQEITSDAPFVLGDALIDATFCEHPGYVKHKLRSYAGAPIWLPDGTLYGTLCGVDRGPKLPSLEAVERLVQVAQEISEEIYRRLSAHVET